MGTFPRGIFSKYLQINIFRLYRPEIEKSIKIQSLVHFLTTLAEMLFANGCEEARMGMQDQTYVDDTRQYSLMPVTMTEPCAAPELSKHVVCDCQPSEY